MVKDASIAPYGTIRGVLQIGTAIRRRRKELGMTQTFVRRLGNMSSWWLVEGQFRGETEWHKT